MKKKTQTFGGYEISVGKKPKTDIPALLREMGQLQKGLMHPYFSPRSYAEEERGISRQSVASTTAFHRNRMRAIDSLRAIVGYIFKTYELPRTDGYDFGSGATGAMVELFLQNEIDGSTWTQVELNPAALETNRALHPDSRILQGSYLNVEPLGIRESLTIATGLSSLDATQFVPRAVSEIASTLKPGGYLLHVQDVRPGLGAGPRQLEHLGRKPPYPMELVPDSDKEALTYRHDRKWIDIGELFRRELKRVVEADECLDLVLNHWVTATKAIPRDQRGLYYFLNSAIGIPSFHETAGQAAHLIHERNPSKRSQLAEELNSAHSHSSMIQKLRRERLNRLSSRTREILNIVMTTPEAKEEATAVVTLARKR